MITLNICLSDIPKGKIIKAKNGKSYVNLVLNERKETGKYGETHSLTVSRTQQEKNNGEQLVYVGNGKEINFSQSTETQKAFNSTDDMPF